MFFQSAFSAGVVCKGAQAGSKRTQLACARMQCIFTAVHRRTVTFGAPLTTREGNLLPPRSHSSSRAATCLSTCRLISPRGSRKNVPSAGVVAPDTPFWKMLTFTAPPSGSRMMTGASLTVHLTVEALEGSEIAKNKSSTFLRRKAGHFDPGARGGVPVVCRSHRRLPRSQSQSQHLQTWPRNLSTEI